MTIPLLNIEYAVLKAKPQLEKLYIDNSGIAELRKGVEGIIAQLSEYPSYKEIHNEFELSKRVSGERFSDFIRLKLPQYANSDDASEILKMYVLYATRNLTDTLAIERFSIAKPDEKALIITYKPTIL